MGRRDGRRDGKRVREAQRWGVAGMEGAESTTGRNLGGGQKTPRCSARGEFKPTCGHGFAFSPLEAAPGKIFLSLSRDPYFVSSVSFAPSKS